MILAGAGAVIAALLAGGYLYDRRHRHERHRRRPGGDMMADIREARRDARAWDSQRGLGDSDLRWTSASRRNRRPHE